MGDRSLWSQIQRSDTYLICRAGWRSIGNRYCEPPELVVVGLEDWEEIKADESDEGLDWKGESWVGVRLERYLIDTGFDDSNIINQVIRIRGRGWSWINNESESQDQQHKTQQKVTIEKRKYIYIYEWRRQGVCKTMYIDKASQVGWLEKKWGQGATEFKPRDKMWGMNVYMYMYERSEERLTTGLTSLRRQKRQATVSVRRDIRVDPVSLKPGWIGESSVERWTLRNCMVETRSVDGMVVDFIK